MPDRHNFQFHVLKARQRQIRGNFSQDFGLRIHRMISWIGRAEQEPGDPAAAFIFLWIAFNTAYSNGADLEGETASERDRFQAFFAQVLKCDADHRLYRAAWHDEARPIRAFIDNRFVFSPFWRFNHGLGSEDWEERFEASKATFENSLRDGETATILSFLFDRLYMLRNQLIHGGATWNSSVNRNQIECGVTLLGSLIPAVADIMMTHPHDSWGRPFFPVIEEPA